MNISRVLQNILSILRVSGYLIVWGRAVRVPREIRSVCVIQSAKLGDMVCTTPIFRAIKARYPLARVIVVGDTLNKEVLAGNADVDEYIVWEGGVSNMKKIFTERKFDAACVTTPNVAALEALYLGGVSVIVVPRVENGWCPTETKLYRLLRNVCIVVPHRMGHYAPGEYLKLLEPLHIHTDDTRKHLSYSGDARCMVKNFLCNIGLIEKKFVAISPSAGNKIKRWPAERFAHVAEYVVSKYGLPVVVIGGKRDKEEVSGMMNELRNPAHVIDASGMFSIDELKALIAQAALFVSVDTGPIYIAEAFGVPTVDITGPIDEHEQPPIGPKNLVVTPRNREKPELFVLNAKMYNTEEAIRQTESITVEDVISAIDSLNLNI